MPLLKKRIEFSTSPKKETDVNSSPDMNKVEKWLDKIDEKPEFEEVSPESKEGSPYQDESKWNRIADNGKTEIPKERIIKKKTKVGFRHKEKKPKIEKIPEETISSELDEEIFSEQDAEKKPFSSIKKKPIIKKDMKDKPVYLEDTGEKLGTIFDSIYDKENNLIGYKIKDNKSDNILSFPSEQFDHNKDGLIFIPGWYTNSVKEIEKLEFKDRVSPDLTALLSDDDIANEELYEIFVKHDDEMTDYIENAISLKEMINNRLRLLEKQRLATKNDLMDLTERRLIKDIDRREFSEEILRHRRKVNILDINIKKCKDLKKRLEDTSFGVLGKINFSNDFNIKKEEQIEKKLHSEILQESKEMVRQNLEGKMDSYKNKYFELKEQYTQLEDDFQELKMAVDKLLNKEDLEELK
jgi:hypothetical protein